MVRPGDTATGLATRYHAWTAELVALNRLGPRARLRVGQRLRIPVVDAAVRRARAEQPARRTHRPLTRHERKLRRHGWRHFRMDRSAVRAMVHRTARRQGVPPRLALAIAWQESGWHQPVRSPAGAVGVMQLLPSTGRWMSQYVGRPLRLRDTHDNVLGGVTLLRVLRQHTRRNGDAIAAYYQGLGAVRRHGWYDETHHYVRTVRAVRDRLARQGHP